jgi:hypothetical protein
MQLLRTVAALLAVYVLASSAAADGSGNNIAAMLGSAAVKGAQQLNTLPATVVAADGPDQYATATADATSADQSATAGAGGVLGSRGFGASGPGQRQRLAVELRNYLERIFRDRPDALSRIRDAWEKEQEQQGTVGDAAGRFDEQATLCSREMRIQGAHKWCWRAMLRVLRLVRSAFS